MDDGRFDAISKLVGSSRSRRQALSGLLGGMVGLLAVAPAETGGRQQKPKKTSKKRQSENHRSRKKRRDDRQQKGNRKDRASRAAKATTREFEVSAGLLQVDYFALGDSIASGHGLNDEGRIGGSGQWCEPKGSPPCCRRSTKAYPHKVASLLSESYQVNLHHIACSAATVQNSLRGQVDEVRSIIRARDRQPAAQGRPTLVSITIGANDLEWGDLLQATKRFVLYSDEEFGQFVSKLTTAISYAVAFQIQRLLEIDGVRVVLTDVHDPFNRDIRSFLWKMYGLFQLSRPFLRPGRLSPFEIPCGLLGCRQRIDIITADLNSALGGVPQLLPVAMRDRIGIAQVHSAFKVGNHEGPQPRCGGGLPGPDQTWIQYPSDPASNSNPKWEIKVGKITRTVAWDGGDCIHPNEKGATAYANAVYDDAVRLGFDGVPRVEVSANRNWRGTGMLVQQGDQFTLSYVSGTWSVDIRNFPSVSPAGYPPEIDARIFQGCKVVATLPYGRLLGVTGNGAIFSVGEGGTFTADADGELFLMINDIVGCHSDNGGTVVMLMSAVPSAQSRAQAEKQPSTSSPPRRASRASQPPAGALTPTPGPSS